MAAIPTIEELRKAYDVYLQEGEPGQPFLTWDEFVQERTGMSPAQVAGVGPYGERWVPNDVERTIDFGVYQDTVGPDTGDDRVIDFGDYQDTNPPLAQQPGTHIINGQEVTIGPITEKPPQKPKPQPAPNNPPKAPAPAAPAPKLGSQYGTHTVNGRQVTVGPLTPSPSRTNTQPRTTTAGGTRFQPTPAQTTPRPVAPSTGFPAQTQKSTTSNTSINELLNTLGVGGNRNQARRNYTPPSLFNPQPIQQTIPNPFQGGQPRGRVNPFGNRGW